MGKPMKFSFQYQNKTSMSADLTSATTANMKTNYLDKL